MNDSERTIRVFAFDTAYHCCGPWPAVGLEASWGLVFFESQRPDRPLATAFDAEAKSLREPYVGGYPTLLCAGGLTAYWDAPALVEGPVAVRGLLITDHHGGLPEDVPHTRGRVSRLWLVSELLVLSEGRFELVEGAEQLSPIDCAPRGIRYLDQSAERQRRTGGVAMDLMVLSPDR